MNQKNCMVAQSGGPTVAINASLAGVIDGVSDSSMYDTVYGSLNGITGILNDDLLNLTELMDGHPEYLSRLAQTPAMYLAPAATNFPIIWMMIHPMSSYLSSLKLTTLKRFSISAATIPWTPC